ncbi:hypothetical protein C0J52_15505 [Blattella germanica]|nr:hypothetical protein C0J52_15505 [Blattella germanica]
MDCIFNVGADPSSQRRAGTIVGVGNQTCTINNTSSSTSTNNCVIFYSRRPMTILHYKLMYTMCSKQLSMSPEIRLDCTRSRDALHASARC